MNLAVLEKNEFVYRKGDETEEVYFLIKGHISILTEDN